MTPLQSISSKPNVRAANTSPASVIANPPCVAAIAPQDTGSMIACETLQLVAAGASDAGAAKYSTHVTVASAARAWSLRGRTG
jgi:hypothetical protein